MPASRKKNHVSTLDGERAGGVTAPFTYFLSIASDCCSHQQCIGSGLEDLALGVALFTKTSGFNQTSQ